MMFIHYIMYKIRIMCTDLNELAFNGKKINQKSYNNIHNKLQPDNIDYIDTIIILYIKYYSELFTNKSLEFLCNKEISEYQFKEFIQKMKEIGFSSNKKGSIQFIDIHDKGNIIYNYDFNSCNPIPIKVNPRKKNKFYSQQYLYKRGK